ncbi:MAG TPA: efflux RND transporter periplasmic adaptor subunit, partial [Vicinamibacterales bacterium]|nr:efflux RND transporter periplasmic adaptor subunit [Vicinamibacterales bacterium]
MKKALIVAVAAVALAGSSYYLGMSRSSQPGDGAAQAGGAAGGRRGGGAGFPGGGGGFPGGGGGFRGGGGGRGPMTVELAKVSRTSLAEEITVVGNLIGDATVSVVPRAAGRLQDLSVRLGDRVNRGEKIAKIEDFEIVEQVKQAEAAQQVSLATIRQREADLQLAETSVERSRSLFERQLLPKQTLDDNEARYQAALAQLDLARAQNQQSKARLDELKINLANTVITSPVNGFVSKRNVDPGAYVSQQTPVADVVDITRVRLVANVVEKDLKELESGNATRVQVDAYPGETFTGRIARVSPVLDPATRTAPIEIEIANPSYRLKPGMYARVGITTHTKKQALVLPSSAVVDLGGRRGVFQLQNETAIFKTVQVGSEQGLVVEILAGLVEGDEVISTGAGALRDGDRVALPGGRAGGNGRGRRGGEANAAPESGGAPAGTPGGARGDTPAGGNVPQAQSASPATRGGQSGKDGATGAEASAGREGYSGRRGDGSGGGSREGGEGRRSGGDSSGRRGGNGTT